MQCPFCGSQDIRNYMDRENDLSWYLCWDCSYQGYDLTLFHYRYAHNNGCIDDASQIEEVNVKKKSKLF